MKYITKLSPIQIKEIMEIYSPAHTDLEYKYTEHCLSVTLRDGEGFEESYDINDFDVIVFDWMGKGDYLRRFREKMLSWFGEQYAVDYLLGYVE